MNASRTQDFEMHLMFPDSDELSARLLLHDAASSLGQTRRDRHSSARGGARSGSGDIMADADARGGEAITVPKAKVRSRLPPIARPLSPAWTIRARLSFARFLNPSIGSLTRPRIPFPSLPASPSQFIEDVDAFMEGKEPEATLNELQGLYQQYKQIEQGLQQNRIRLGNKLPEIKRALDTVKMLCDKAGSGEELDMNFELTDAVYAKAKVKDAESVYLWLGANVMLEYPLEEAKELLETNYQNCKNNLGTNRSDLAFVKDNVTITEVSIARVYNWDVRRRKEEAAKGKK